MRTQFSYAWVMALGLSGCQMFAGVQLTKVALASGKPSNVAALVKVERKDEPVLGLRPNAFRVSENEHPLENSAVDLRLLDPTAAVAFHTVLLLDVNHASDEAGRLQLGKAVAGFVRTVSASQPVTVLAFDGSPYIRTLVDVPANTAGNDGVAPEKLNLGSTDPSRNLRGALIEALDLLDSRLENARRVAKVGTVVVFSRGPDMASRAPESELDARMSRSEHRFLFVGMAGDPGESELTRLSENGRFEAKGSNGLAEAFAEAASRTVALTNNYYLVSYCSPSRSGDASLRLEVEVVDDELKTEKSAFETHFDASGFTAGCDSSKPPTFVLPQRASGN